MRALFLVGKGEEGMLRRGGLVLNGTTSLEKVERKGRCSAGGT